MDKEEYKNALLYTDTGHYTEARIKPWNLEKLRWNVSCVCGNGGGGVSVHLVQCNFNQIN